MKREERVFVDQLLELARTSQDQVERQQRVRAFVDRLLDIHGTSPPPPSDSTAAERRFEEVVIANWTDIERRVQAGVAERMSKLDDRTRRSVELLGSVPSLLSPMGKSRDELCHSKLMTWLLGLDNDLGVKARRAFADLVGADDVPAAGWRVRAEHQVAAGCRIDVDIEVPGRWRCFVEMKVDAMERDKQLSDYAEALKDAPGPDDMDRLLVFLTPDGRESAERGVRYTARSFEVLAARWLPLCLQGGPEADYLAMWLRTITDELLEVCGDGPPEKWPLSQQLAIVDLVEKGRNKS